MQSTRQLALEKLKSSGLGPDDLTWETHEAPEMAALGFFDRPALVLPYIDPWTGKPLTHRPKWPAFKRYRYLIPPPAPKDGKVPRYSQVKNSGVCAYFPTGRDWPTILDNYELDLLITEGELKSAKACREGFNCIGLGGVSNFQGTQSATGFLPELEKIRWARRRVYIVYDSDTIGNANIVHACNTLAKELEERGAVPFAVVLPEVIPGNKCGLDDYLLVRSSQDLAEYIRAHRESLTLSRPMWAMNSEVMFVQSPPMIVQRDTGTLIGVEPFKNSVYANRLVPELVLKDDGTTSIKKKPLAQAWLKWPLRAQANSLTYLPGKPREVDGCYNTWNGWGTKPVKGDVSLYLKLIDHLFSTTSSDAKEWFLRWCAYPIQFPGTKMFSAVAIHGVKQGTGKSFLGYCLGRVYGKNFTEIQERDLHNGFNEWARDKQLVMGDDVTGSDKRSMADQLKSMVTQKELRVNVKYVPSFTVPDCVNYLFTSQNPDAFFLEDDDRRFFVHEVSADPLPAAFYKQLEIWLASEAGGNALHYFLLHLPLGDFDPRQRALSTDSKRAMIDVGKSDLALFCDRLRDTPDLVLRVGKAPVIGDLHTSRDLLELYDPTLTRKVGPNAMAKALKRAGFGQVCKGVPVRWSGGQDRYFAVRESKKWIEASPADVRKHLEKTKK